MRKDTSSASFGALGCGAARWLCACLIGLTMLAAMPARAEISDPDPTALKPGQYLWHPEIAPQGPLVIVVSLDEQRLYVYRNGVAIGFSTISSGRRGHETPTGVFTILQKDRDHHSNKYDDAPMPFMERLTWDGVAMHGGTLPGYPASHGCVRLPQHFAEQLYAVTERGETVVVASGKASPIEIVHPAVIAPVTANGAPADLRDPADAAFTWDDDAAPAGPLSIVVSVADRRVHVLRSGIRIGTSRVDVMEGFAFHGAVVFVRLQGSGGAPAEHTDAVSPPARWAMYAVRGAPGDMPTMEALAAGLKVPDEFALRVQAALQPGTSILVTDRPALRGISAADGATQPVLESEPRRDGKLGTTR